MITNLQTGTECPQAGGILLCKECDSREKCKFAEIRTCAEQQYQAPTLQGFIRLVEEVHQLLAHAEYTHDQTMANILRIALACLTPLVGKAVRDARRVHPVPG
ncbi:MAG: hypothetical protein RBG13Loki_4251 [Promethearchaeota archaeon CR_4]|nr:MAG: hypothetical protein RBG13Loki_4251 [Candidatus Lokiarchaeota archaeon CR_4]